MTQDNQIPPDAGSERNRPEDGGPAFPFVSHGGVHEHQFVSSGMTLWDYFAAQSILTAWADLDRGKEIKDEPIGQSAIAKKACEIADALIAERKKRFGGEK